MLPGCGRLLTLDKPVTLSTVIQRVKRHLNLSLVRLAVGNGTDPDKAVQTVAICAGSGKQMAHVVRRQDMSMHSPFHIAVYLVTCCVYVYIWAVHVADTPNVWLALCIVYTNPNSVL